MSLVENWWQVLAEELRNDYPYNYDWIDRPKMHGSPIANSSLVGNNSHCFITDTDAPAVTINRIIAKNYRAADWALKYIYKHLKKKFSSLCYADYGPFMGHEFDDRRGIALYFEDDYVDWRAFCDAVESLPCRDFADGGSLADLRAHSCPEFPDAWGWWQLVPVRSRNGKASAYLKHFETGYAVDLDNIDSTRELVDWIYHLSRKNIEVYGDGCLQDLCQAFRAIYGPAHSLPETFDGQKILKTYLAKARNKGRSMSPGLRHRVFERDGFRCCDCGASPQTDGVTLEVDHRIALAKGGTNDLDNLRTLCRDCNAGKSARDIDYPHGHR